MRYYEEFGWRSREGEQEAAIGRRGSLRVSGVNFMVLEDSFVGDIVDCRVREAVGLVINRQLFATRGGRVY